MGLLYGAAEGLVMGPGPASLTRAQVDAIAAPSLGVRLGDGPEILSVLTSDAPHSKLWTAGKSFALQTDAGRIVRSAGFSANLSGVSTNPGETHAPAAALRRGGERTLAYDFADLNVYSVKAVCTVSDHGRENIQILGRIIPTQRIVEHCRAELLDWTFENTFWLGERSGLVWQSVQHIHPRLGAITTELLRAPEGSED
ncbi:MAG TPA: YjbF family lipoprotein [Rhizomicrobium sp.]|nr:YjbF family lipoprotein [Rhizomicrobium sp.]